VVLGGINKRCFCPSLFVLNINSKYQIPTYDNASFDNSNSNNEKIHYTPMDSMIDYFLNVLKIMDYKNIICYVVLVKIFTL
jgi:hypothetical protein